MTVISVTPKPPAGSKRKLVLEEFAPYRIVALGHAISGRLARAYRDENITIPEWRVLAVIGEAAQAKGIKEVYYDRNGFLYAGRIKALADAVREKGIKF